MPRPSANVLEEELAPTVSQPRSAGRKPKRLSPASSVEERRSMPGDGAGEDGGVAGGGSTGGGFRCPAPISRLRVEKIEGGLMVAGVVVAANCQLALPAFGFLFVLVGCVLTAASYRGPAEDEEPEHYAARIAFTGNSRVLGPACIVVGLLMLAAGVGLCLLTRRARRRERRVGFHCPLHGDFYPLSPVSGARSFAQPPAAAAEAPHESCYCAAPPTAAENLASPDVGSEDGKPGSQWALCWRRGGDGEGTGPLAGGGPPQCPHSTLSSTRSSVSSTPASPCPTPLPFLVTSGSVSAMVPSVGANLSPDQTFGSIRSLSVSREVASFPLSRTPSPPPGSERLLSPSLSRNDETAKVPLSTLPTEVAPTTQPEITVVAPASPPTSPVTPVSPNPLFETKTPVSANRGPRKSVSIVLPEEDKG